MSLGRSTVVLLGVVFLVSCGSSKPATDGLSPGAERTLPGKGPAGCACKSDEVCVEVFDGRCVSLGNSCVKLPAGCTSPCSCGGGDAGAYCHLMSCCASATANVSTCFEPCRVADPDRKYFTCSGA